MTNKITALPFRRLKILEPAFIYQHDNESWHWKSQRRDYYNLWVCLAGSGQMQCNGVHFAIRPWTAFLLPPEMAIIASSTSETIVKNFSAHWQPRFDLEIDLPKSLTILGQVIHETDTAQALIQSLLRLSAFHDPLAQQQSEWLLLEMIALLWREYQSPHESPADAIIYQQIERMRGGQKLFASVDELAYEAHLSRIHYGRRFRRITTESPNRFLIRQRIGRACVLLRGTNWTIESIADKIGYSDVYFFSRQFRQQMDQTPRRYREHLRD